MRSYRKNDEILRELREHIESLRRQGITRLESGRKLAGILHTGRPSVGKAIRVLEEQRVLARDCRTLHILPRRQRFRYAFAASVHSINDTFLYPAYFRLWEEVRKRVTEAHLEIELVLYDPASDAKTTAAFLERLETFDVVFFSLINEENIAGLIGEPGSHRYAAFLLDENMEIPGYPLYCLGNYQVGEVAARCLLEHGYRHPALISPHLNTSTLDFSRRIEGFTATMKQYGVADVQLCSVNTGMLTSDLTLIQRSLETLPGSGFDSVFFLEDRWIMLVDPLFREGRIPEFGVIAFDGTMMGRCHQPPVTTISHATIPLAECLCGIVREWESSLFRFDPEVRRRFTPEIIPGYTIRNKTAEA